MSETSVPKVQPVSQELRDLIDFEVGMMTGSESDALYEELRQTIIRKMADDRYRGNHAAAFGAACRLVLSLIRNVGATTGQRGRLKALAVGMLKAEWDSDKDRDAQ